MPNESYCRFRNTVADFMDCYRALEQLAAGELERLSEQELAASKLLAVLSHDFLTLLCERCEISIDDLDTEKLEAAMQAINDVAPIRKGH